LKERSHNRGGDEDMRNSNAGHCAPLGLEFTENDKSRVLDVSNSFKV
jgi:hypothetical protein